MTILYFILALIALGFLVFIHELGHYWVARLVGMRVEIFSIGFGKPLMQWQSRAGVKWQWGSIPFGGFVKIAGMETSKEKADDVARGEGALPEMDNGFFSKSPLARIAVVLAGPVANLILALIAFAGLWLAGGREKSFAEYTQIVGWVDPQAAIYRMGLHPGDTVSELNGKPYCGFKDLLYASFFGKDKLDIEAIELRDLK